jgi:hypothetical protein
MGTHQAPTPAQRKARFVPCDASSSPARNAWITPDRGIVIDGEVIPHHDSRTTEADELIPPSPEPPSVEPATDSEIPDTTGAAASVENDQVPLLRDGLEAAAERGTAALRAAWHTHCDRPWGTKDGRFEDRGEPGSVW